MAAMGKGSTELAMSMSAGTGETTSNRRIVLEGLISRSLLLPSTTPPSSMRTFGPEGLSYWIIHWVM